MECLRLVPTSERSPKGESFGKDCLSGPMFGLLAEMIDSHVRFHQLIEVEQKVYLAASYDDGFAIIDILCNNEIPFRVTMSDPANKESLKGLFEKVAKEVIHSVFSLGLNVSIGRVEKSAKPCIETVGFIKGGSIIGEFPLHSSSSFSEREDIGYGNGLSDWDFHCIMQNGEFIKDEGGIVAQYNGVWNYVVLLDENLKEFARSEIKDN